ncbi:MAG: site-specific integrase [[Clostridium] innocuum]|nr:site-specific integrase [[Clostridium] innocuum]MBS5685845.1 site-specific integrase [[Clostridium] innocuum]
MQTILPAQQLCANPFMFQMNIENPKLLNEWLPLYLNDISKHITINTYNNYNSYIFKHILPELGELTLTELTTPVIKKYIIDKMDHGRIRINGVDKGLSAKTVKEHYTLLKKALDKAVEDGEMYFNPCHSISFPKQIKAEVHPLEQEEQIKLEKHIRSEFKANSAMTAKIALYGGLRNGEICALKVKDIDLDRSMISVSKTLYRASTSIGKTEIIVNKTKNKRERFVPIPESLLDDLKTYLSTMPEEMRNNPEQYLFINQRGKPLEPKRLLCHFKELLKEAGLQDIKFHDLRHTFATRCLECGIDMKIVSKILGHSTIQITADLYTHVTNRAMKNAMSKLAKENWNNAYQSC